MEGNVRPINANAFAEHLKDWKYDIENDYYIDPSKRSIISDTLEQLSRISVITVLLIMLL